MARYSFHCAITVCIVCMCDTATNTPGMLEHATLGTPMNEVEKCQAWIMYIKTQQLMYVQSNLCKLMHHLPN